MSMRAFVRCGAAAFVAVMAGAGPVPAADAVLPLVAPSAFYEVYLDDPPSPTSRGPAAGAGTVGAVIVGLRFDAGATKFSPDRLRIALGGRPRESGTLCLKIISRDGKYFARGLYELQPGTQVVVPPEFPSKYKARIAAYDVADIAVSAARSASCDDLRDASWVPVVYDTPAPASKLVVQLRAGDSRLRAQIGSETNETVGPAVLCTSPVSGPTIGFTTECTLPLPETLPSGAYKLSIGETGAKGEIVVRTYPVTLRLPGVPRS